MSTIDSCRRFKGTSELYLKLLGNQELIFLSRYGPKDVKAIANFVGTRNPTQVMHLDG
jgi:hypothetical protein